MSSAIWAMARRLRPNPYTQALLSAVLRLHTRKTKRILLKGEQPSPAAPPSGCVFRTRCPHALSACAEAVPPLAEVEPGHYKACIREDIA